MGKKISNFKVGLFMIAAVILAVSTVLALGLGDTFKENLQCETYFDSSVQGVSTGGQVLLRGIKVGQITGISLAGAAYAEGGQMILIRFNIDPKMINSSGSIKEARQEIIGSIEKGLRAKLAFAGVTGAAVLELDYLNLSTAERPIQPAWTPERLYIPSTPSLISEVGQSLTKITQSLENVDFKGMSERADQTAQSLTRTLGRVDELMEEATAAIVEIKSAVIQVRKLAQEGATFINKANIAVGQLDNVRLLVANSTKTLQSVDTFIRQLELALAAPQGDLENILENLRITSDNLRALSSTARDYPSQTILGDKPPKVKYDQRK